MCFQIQAERGAEKRADCLLLLQPLLRFLIAPEEERPQQVGRSDLEPFGYPIRIPARDSQLALSLLRRPEKKDKEKKYLKISSLIQSTGKCQVSTFFIDVLIDRVGFESVHFSGSEVLASYYWSAGMNECDVVYTSRRPHNYSSFLPFHKFQNF